MGPSRIISSRWSRIKLWSPAFGEYKTPWTGPHITLRQSSSDSGNSSRKTDDPPAAGSTRHDRARRKLIERDFFLSVLSATTTKRDAKSYLSRFNRRDRQDLKPSLGSVPKPIGSIRRATQQYDPQVNLGSLYAPAKAIEDSPVFTHQEIPDKYLAATTEPLHVAIVKIRAPQTLTDETLDGVGLTLAQLARLGLLSVVVVDCDEKPVEQDLDDHGKSWKQQAGLQATRIVDSIQSQSKEGARLVDQALGYKEHQNESSANLPVNGQVEVQLSSLLLTPLRHGMIPVLPSIAYSDNSKIRKVKADDVVLALSREFAGLNSTFENNSQDGLETNSAQSTNISLDRIIVLDPLGGIPAVHSNSSGYVFINLQQEYPGVRAGLIKSLRSSSRIFEGTIEAANLEHRTGGSEAYSTEENLHHGGSELSPNGLSESARHLETLDLLKRCLKMLPPSSSALIATPDEVSSSAYFSTSPIGSTGVRTRQKRNPLIHNLLTNKPLISSSLPLARFKKSHLISQKPSLPLTFLKWGMPVTIMPDPRTSPWTIPNVQGTPLRLESDPRIDFPRLLHLIEDSFGRKLNVEHYLSRIESHIAGIIIAGNYEGGAILTWEQPPDRPNRPLVPYLDKFAVLRSSQGSGGVADIVFNAMVRDCFPHGVVWRSRRENPVNKWYFERASGTWRVPDSGWTMFWTGRGVDFAPVEGEQPSEAEERWRDYVAVCQGVQASWADMNPPD